MRLEWPTIAEQQEAPHQKRCGAMMDGFEPVD
jgi:hypothetical protein